MNDVQTSIESFHRRRLAAIGRIAALKEYVYEQRKIPDKPLGEILANFEKIIVALEADLSEQP